MSNYYNSRPRRYRRTLGKQMIQDFYNTGWFTLVVLAVVSVGLYQLIFNYSDELVSFMDASWDSLNALWRTISS